MTYKRINDIVGWLVFAISLTVFIMTMAPTSSFWDCGEFISCANELQVPHPPGPPVFLLIGRIFAMFAGGNVAEIAWWVNLVSALSSAFTVLFTFWIITILGKKLLDEKDGQTDANHTALLMFAGIVGSMACCFSDSFWFNAVEAEVYAMSSLCTAAVVWLMLKWEARADEPDHLRWIVLIAYVVGLSISVHLLNLLAIPGLAVMYYFKKHEFSFLGLLATLGISFVILIFIQYGVIQESMSMVTKLEVLFVGLTKIDGSLYTTGMGFPQGTGLWVFSFILACIMGGLLWFSHSRNHAWVNVGVVSTATILVGYSTYMVIAIRANAGTPINENDPGNAVTMLSYMRREQYGDNPLFRGPLYNVNPNDPRSGAKVVNTEPAYQKFKEPFWFPMDDGSYSTSDGQNFTVSKGSATGLGELSVKSMLKDSTLLRINSKTKMIESYRRVERYVWDGYKRDYQYPSKSKVIFPRMHSGNHFDEKGHNYGYEKYVKRKGKPGDPSDDKPTQAENFAFFLDYQVRHMYIRYFMWNFVGREGDIQDMGSEIGFGSSDLPDFMKNDPGKNHYYALPLLLGILGLVWQSIKRVKDASIVMMLFLFTGVAIVIYLNQTPSQPRERDYSYVGSFQTFCIWIGLGVIGIYELLRSFLGKSSQYIAGGMGIIMAPFLMGKENWDDHSRHFQYVPPDSAYNLLMSCKPNALIFTNGDNDTFPLWYVQEVEGIRTDVRVVNLSLLNTDWYIDQMRGQSNLSEALPATITEADYRGEKNSVVNYAANTVVDLPVDIDKVIANGTVPAEYASLIESPLKWTVRTRGSASNAYLLKQDYIILNIMQTNAANGWERPIYFSSTIPTSSFMNLQDWFQAEGLAYRVVPYRRKNNDPYPVGFLNLERSYTLLKDTFRYRELDNPELYLDEHIRRTIIGNLNNTFYRVITNFLTSADKMTSDNSQYENALKIYSAAGNKSLATDSLKTLIAKNEGTIADYRKKGKELLDFREEKMPYKLIEVDPVLHTFLGQAYYDLGDKEKGKENSVWVAERQLQQMKYYKDHKQNEWISDRDITAVQIASQNLDKNGDSQIALDFATRLYEVTGDPRHQQMIDGFRRNSQLAPTNPDSGAGK